MFVLRSEKVTIFAANRELKQATFLSTRTPTESKSRRYRWRMIVSAVLVLNQQRQSISFHVRDAIIRHL